MTTPSNILARGTPWKEEPGRLHSMGSQRVRHNWATKQERKEVISCDEELPAIILTDKNLKHAPHPITRKENFLASIILLTSTFPSLKI